MEKTYEKTKQGINKALEGLSQQEAHDFMLWYIHRLKAIYPMILQTPEKEAFKKIDEIMNMKEDELKELVKNKLNKSKNHIKGIRKIIRKLREIRGLHATKRKLKKYYKYMILEKLGDK